MELEKTERGCESLASVCQVLPAPVSSSGSSTLTSLLLDCCFFAFIIHPRGVLGGRKTKLFIYLF